MKKVQFNPSITETFLANNLTILVFTILMASLLSACSSTKLIEKTDNTTQGTFNITSRAIDADINGWKYFGFYIFNSAKDINIKIANTAGVAPANSTDAAYVAQTLRQDLDKLMGMDITKPSSYIYQQTQTMNDATDAAQAALGSYSKKAGTSLATTLIGENSFSDLINAKFTHPKEKDLQDAEYHTQIAKLAQNNIDDRFNLFFAGIAQINYATSAKINMDGAVPVKLVISTPLLAQASAQRISYPKDYAKATDDSIDNTGVSNYVFNAAISRFIIKSISGDLMQCEIYRWVETVRNVGACVNANGDTYIISTHLNQFTQ